MIKPVNSLMLGLALIGFGACSNASDINAAADTPKAETATETTSATYEALGVPSGAYIMDKSHGYVTFSYSHKGLSRPVLRFKNVDAALTLDAENPENSTIDVTIQAANIESDVPKFNTHLNSADFFNTAVNPTITFKTTGFTRSSATSGNMSGDVTMMGVTKSIVFDVNLLGVADSKPPTIGVEGSSKLLRSDYGLGKWAPVIGDEVSISISAEFNKSE